MALKYLILTLILSVPFTSFSQEVHHWETAVFNYNTWTYMTGDNEVPGTWTEVDFNDDFWQTGIGGIGYADGDDQTIISPTISVYMRTHFTIEKMSAIAQSFLSADYDDGFVAYLNGIEIARANMPMDIEIEPDVLAIEYHEAQLYQQGIPEDFFINNWESILVEGDNVLAVQVHNHSANSSDLSSNFFLHVGINNSKNYFSDPPSWFNPNYLQTELPLVIIQTEGNVEIPDEPKIIAQMKVIDNGSGQINSELDVPNAYDGRISIEIRGSSSQLFPKKNYGFETQDQEGNNNNVSLLGLAEENDWVFHGPYADKSLLRNVLGYHIADGTERYAPRTKLCEMIINGDYRGVYVLTERIKRDENRVDIANLKPEDTFGDQLTGGYIFQIDRDNPNTNDDGWYSSFPDYKFYAFDDPDYDDLVPVQKSYLQDWLYDFESMMAGDEYIEAYEDFVDVNSWIDYFLVNEVAKHIDAFKLSFFMHKDRDSVNKLLQFGPVWDLNLGFGNFDFDCSPDPEGWAYEFRGTCADWHPFWVAKLTDIPNVQHKINCRWQELREGAWSTENLINYLNTQVELLDEPQERNFERWPILGSYVWPNDFIGKNYEEEAYFLTAWLVERLSWMDENMLGDCTLVGTDITPVDYFTEVHIFPNPTPGHLNIEFKNKNFDWIYFNLYDAFGEKIFSKKIDESRTSLSLGNLKPAMYFYSLSNGDETYKFGKLSILYNS